MKKNTDVTVEAIREDRVFNLTLGATSEEERARTLKMIEDKISNILNETFGSWNTVAILMMKVNDENLWDVKHKSFTAWVKDYAARSKKHESYLWKLLKAGRTYKEYEERQKEKNKKVTSLSDLKVDYGSLELAKKVAGADKDKLDTLCKEIEDGELTRNTLKSVWHEVRQERKEKNIKAPVNSYTEYEDDNIKIKDVLEDTAKTKAITELIKKKATVWINSKDEDINNKTRAFEEFPVRTGLTRNARRMDLLVVTNLDIDKHDKKYELSLYCIEVKVSLQDLKQDIKTTEYKDFVDGLYFAIPHNDKDMLHYIEEEQLKDFGILLCDIDKKNVEVYRPAKIEKGKLREVTLMTILQKIL